MWEIDCALGYIILRVCGIKLKKYLNALIPNKKINRTGRLIDYLFLMKKAVSLISRFV